MADFCCQCALELFPPNEPYQCDLAGLSTAQDTARGLYPVVLCEGCGPTQVDHNGICVAWDCLSKHAPKPSKWGLAAIWLRGAAHSPTVRRRVLLAVLLAGAALSLGGCAALEASEGWERAPRHKALPVHYIYVEGKDLAPNCGWPRLSNFTLHACSKRVPEADVCLIFTEPNPPQWIKSHEEKHCAGYEHDGQTPGFVLASERR